MVTTRKLGRFSVSFALLEYRWQDLLPAFDGVIVVRADSRWDTRGIDYVALCEDFDPVEEGVESPKYEAELTKHADGTITRKWKRLDASS